MCVYVCEERPDKEDGKEVQKLPSLEERLVQLDVCLMWEYFPNRRKTRECKKSI